MPVTRSQTEASEYAPRIVKAIIKNLEGYDDAEFTWDELEFLINTPITREKVAKCQRLRQYFGFYPYHCFCGIEVLQSMAKLATYLPTLATDLEASILDQRVQYNVLNNVYGHTESERKAYVKCLEDIAKSGALKTATGGVLCGLGAFQIASLEEYCPFKGAKNLLITSLPEHEVDRSDYEEVERVYLDLHLDAGRMLFLLKFLTMLPNLKQIYLSGEDRVFGPFPYRLGERLCELRGDSLVIVEHDEDQQEDPYATVRGRAKYFNFHEPFQFPPHDLFVREKDFLAPV